MGLLQQFKTLHNTWLTPSIHKLISVCALEAVCREFFFSNFRKAKSGEVFFFNCVNPHSCWDVCRKGLFYFGRFITGEHFFHSFYIQIHIQQWISTSVNVNDFCPSLWHCIYVRTRVNSRTVLRKFGLIWIYAYKSCVENIFQFTFHNERE